jgi:hypothetical protein
MLKATELFDLEPLARKEKIVSQITDFGLLNDKGTKFSKSKAITNVINSFIDDYFDYYIKKDNENSKGSILLPENMEHAIQSVIKDRNSRILDIFNGVPKKDSMNDSYLNIYEMSDALKLAVSNHVTRRISNLVGGLWEDFATISPYAINPDHEFKLKIVGIDLISQNFETNEVEYQQLKTGKGTLTGSQAPRSKAELSIHDNPVFCVALENKSSWTFNDPIIPRVSGVDFWKRIGMPYETVEAKAIAFIKDIERKFSELTK